MQKKTVGGLEMEQRKPTNEGRKLVWADEFDQSAIDRTKWTFELGNGLSDANGNWVAGLGNNEKEEKGVS
jgi:hypothetical protein